MVKPYLEQIPAEEAEKRGQVKKIITRLEEEILRDVVLDERTRFDSRRLDEIRNIEIEVGLLPRTHGSALFTRGETQALVSATLGTSRDAQVIEEYEGESIQKFMLHYNFPPFSVGEVKFLRGPGRREIGHGVLARRALLPVLPHEDEFPYTIRVVSDILESNGSSSMATVCGGSLAMFDAGVPLLAPVAGVAMGLIKGEDNFAVLTDIAGQEDHYGDMDFKVAGTRERHHRPPDGHQDHRRDPRDHGAGAGAGARPAACTSSDIMEQALPAARAVDISKFAPRLYTLQIPKEKIRDVIGPGGKTIRSIIEETGCDIEIEDDGKVIIASPDEPAARRAIQMIERLTEVPEIGKLYTGQVRRVEAYGAFVEIMPGTDGLVHISELAPYRVREVSDVRQGRRRDDRQGHQHRRDRPRAAVAQGRDHGGARLRPLAVRGDGDGDGGRRRRRTGASARGPRRRPGRTRWRPGWTGWAIAAAAAATAAVAAADAARPPRPFDAVPWAASGAALFFELRLLLP